MCSPNTELPRDDQEVLKHVANFWNILSTLDQLDGATRGALEEMQVKVSDALYRFPPDVKLAVQLTAKAMLILSNLHEV